VLRGLEDETLRHVREYRGGMVRMDADTYRQAWAPDDREKFSLRQRAAQFALPCVRLYAGLDAEQARTAGQLRNG